MDSFQGWMQVLSLELERRWGRCPEDFHGADWQQLFRDGFLPPQAAYHVQYASLLLEVKGAEVRLKSDVARWRLREITEERHGYRPAA